MMTALREWLASLVAVTLLISLVQTLAAEGTMHKVTSFVGGLILLAVLLRPLAGAELECLKFDLSNYQSAVEEQQRALESAGQEQLAEEIARLTEEQIKAQAVKRGLNLAIQVKTEANADGLFLPTEATVKGKKDSQLAEWIERELGIPQSRQNWKEP